MERISSDPAAVLVVALILFTIPGTLSKGDAHYDANMPFFMKSSRNFTFREGETAILDCRIANLNKKRVVWRHASSKIPLTVGTLRYTPDARFSVMNEGTNWKLRIQEVKKDDSGIYECQVSSRMRHLRRHISLIILDRVRRGPRIRITGTTYVDEGQPISLKCNATSYDFPPEEIDWFRSGTALDDSPSEGMTISKSYRQNALNMVSFLEIKQAKQSDHGTYVCRTSNRDVTSIHVSVLKGDSYNVKRNTEKKVNEDASYYDNRRHSYYSNKDNNNGGHASTPGLAFPLVISFVTSLVTSICILPREVT